jgi:hypothetical protein
VTATTSCVWLDAGKGYSRACLMVNESVIISILLARQWFENTQQPDF